MPHSQGINEYVLADAIFIPNGNAIPINNPMGKSIPEATRIRMIVVDYLKVTMKCPENAGDKNLIHQGCRRNHENSCITLFFCCNFVMHIPRFIALTNCVESVGNKYN